MKHRNMHHVLPRSRGGHRRHNLVKLPVPVHNAWHTLFGNLTVDEAHVLIDRVFQKNTAWTNRELHDLREKIKEEE